MRTGAAYWIVKARISLVGLLTMRIREYLRKRGETREYLGKEGIFGQFLPLGRRATV
jgi:hypothetical protein